MLVLPKSGPFLWKTRWKLMVKIDKYRAKLPDFRIFAPKRLTHSPLMCYIYA